MKWTIFIVGFFLIVSPWVFGFSAVSLAKWCNVLSGLVLAIAGAWGLFGEPSMVPVADPVGVRDQQFPHKRKANANDQNQQTSKKNINQ